MYQKKQFPNDGDFLLILWFHFIIVSFLETKNILVELIKTINRDFSEEFGNTVSSLGPEVTNSLQNLFATT